MTKRVPLAPFDRLVRRAAFLTCFGERTIMDGRYRRAAWTRYQLALVVYEAEGIAHRSTCWIARKFGQDHSTISYGLERARQLAARDPEYNRVLELLRAEWRGFYG